MIISFYLFEEKQSKQGIKNKTEQKQKQKDQIANKLNSTSSQQAGDLVLYRTTTGVCIYGRVGAIFGKNLSVYVCPTESSEEFTRTDRVVCLTSEMIHRCNDVREAQILINNPVDEFYSVMNDEILRLTYDFLTEQGFFFSFLFLLLFFFF